MSFPAELRLPFGGSVRCLFLLILVGLLPRAVVANHALTLSLADTRPIVTEWAWSLRWHASPIVALALSCLVWRWRPRSCLRSALVPRLGAGYRSPPDAVVEVDRAAFRRASGLYLVRMLPVLVLFAWGAPPFAPIFIEITGCCFCRGFIAPGEYLLLFVEWTAVLLLHVPTWSRIAGLPLPSRANRRAGPRRTLLYAGRTPRGPSHG